MTSLPTLEVLDARSLNTPVHAAIPKAAGPDAQRRSRFGCVRRASGESLAWSALAGPRLLLAQALPACLRRFSHPWPQLFSDAPGLEQPDRLLDSREKSLVKMCLLHLNLLYSLRRNAAVHLVKAPRHTPPRESIADFHGGTNSAKEGYGGGCATSRS